MTKQTRNACLTSALMLLVTFLAGLLGGCAPPYRQAFWDEGKQQKWTEKQTKAAFAYADRIFSAHEMPEGSGKYVILYGKVPTSKVREQLETVLKNFDSALDPRNAEMRQYLEQFNLRSDLEHDEAITETIHTRVAAADLEHQFQQDMGEIPAYGPEAEMTAGYNIRKIFLAKDMAQAFPFKSEVIEGAKKDGTLVEIEHGSFSISSKYDHKDSDPNKLDDQNEFVWKAKNEGIELTNYKIVDVDKPTDNQGNYIEGFRVVDGHKESLPCLKIFFPPSGGPAIILVDTDREGDPGYGIPDILQQTGMIHNVSDVIRTSDLVDSLFVEKKQEKRVLPPHTLFAIEISRLDSPSDPWQQAPDASGYSVPFKYMTGLGDNYNIRIHFKTPKIDPADPESMAKMHTGLMDVDYIEKEYTASGNQYMASTGQVIEYYRPKAAFATQVKAEVLNDDNTKKVSFVYADGTEVDGFIPPGPNKFIEDKPYAISFNEGQKRWYIEKHDSDVFSRRRTVSPPKEKTGEYDIADTATEQAGAHPMSDNPDDDDPFTKHKTR